jgi:hypothetical protein
VGSVNRSTNTDDGKPWTDTLNEQCGPRRGARAAGRASVELRRSSAPRSTRVPRPTWGDGYSYQLPADCLRWLPQAKDSSGCDIAATREGGALVA